MKSIFAQILDMPETKNFYERNLDFGTSHSDEAKEVLSCRYVGFLVSFWSVSLCFAPFIPIVSINGKIFWIKLFSVIIGADEKLHISF